MAAMPPTSVEPQVAGAGDQAVKAATGKDWPTWFALLDTAGAAAWKHPAIARWLVDTGVDAWWAQAITVAYEQARGLRQPGQRQDGRYETSASRTIVADQAAALAATITTINAALGTSPAATNPTAKYATARWSLSGGESLLATIAPSKLDKTSVTLTWGKLPDESRLPTCKATLRGWLQSLA